MTAQKLAALSSRNDIVTYLRDSFPHLLQDDAVVSNVCGGRKAALAALGTIRPDAYQRTRNFLTGDVTRLSPYLRHGVLTLAEVRDHALNAGARPADAAKFVNELAWRDYWQRLYFQLEEGIWEEREELKTGFAPEDYADDLPAVLAEANTTLACMDAFSRELSAEGYLHNHARMWLASYLVHWLRVRWQTGARWFYSHLLDGDSASNNLSWQWIASSFASKPYIFNRENLERYTDGAFCRACPHAALGTCPFEGTYEALEQQLFPRLHQSREALPYRAPARAGTTPDYEAYANFGNHALLWVHTDGLNPDWPSFTHYPGSPSVFIWDEAQLHEDRLSLKRLLFLAECLREMPAELSIRKGDLAAELLAAAREHGATHIIALRTPDPRLQAVALALQEHLPVLWIEPPPFAASLRAFDLKRFSRYWQRAQSSAMQPTAVLP